MKSQALRWTSIFTIYFKWTTWLFRNECVTVWHCFICNREDHLYSFLVLINPLAISEYRWQLGPFWSKILVWCHNRKKNDQSILSLEKGTTTFNFSSNGPSPDFLGPVDRWNHIKEKIKAFIGHWIVVECV